MLSSVNNSSIMIVMEKYFSFHVMKKGACVFKNVNMLGLFVVHQLVEKSLFISLAFDLHIQV